MSTSSIKVFRPLLILRLVSVFMVLPCLFFVYSIIINDPTLHGANLLFSGIHALIFLTVALSLMTEKITITDQAVVIGNIFQKKVFPLSLIKRCKKEDRMRARTFVIIESNDLVITTGWFSTEDQLNELESYIFQQIKVFYPENYDAVKTDRFGVEKFWRK